MAIKENNENLTPAGQDMPADAGYTQKPRSATPSAKAIPIKDGLVKDNSMGSKVAPAESGGRGGLDPTRFGDWEIAGKCVDF